MLRKSGGGLLVIGSIVGLALTVPNTVSARRGSSNTSFAPSSSIDCEGTITWEVTLPPLSGYQLVALVDQTFSIGPLALDAGGAIAGSAPGFDPLVAHGLDFQLVDGGRVRDRVAVPVGDGCMPTTVTSPPAEADPVPPTTVAPPATDPTTPPTTDPAAAPTPPPATDPAPEPSAPPLTDPPPVTTTTTAAVDEPPPPVTTVPVTTVPPTTAAPVPTTVPAPATSFRFSPSAPRVGVPVTFDGSALACDPATACSYTWQWFFRSADGTTTLTGGQMGLTPTVTYTFDAFAASKPFVIVELTVAEGRVGPRHTYSTSFTVQG